MEFIQCTVLCCGGNSTYHICPIQKFIINYLEWRSADADNSPFMLHTEIILIVHGLTRRMQIRYLAQLGLRMGWLTMASEAKFIRI